MTAIRFPFFVCLMTSSLALAAPDRDARSDGRIQTFTYSANRVIPIYTAPGSPTLIQFEDDETVVDKAKGMIGIGDAKAWSVGPKGSNIMLKPAAARPDTTMLIVTTKRTYAFDIKSIKRKSAIEPTLVVRFIYPDSQAKADLNAAKKRDLLNLRLSRIAEHGDTSRVINRNFMKQGHDAIAPTQMYDDDRFTFFVFDTNRVLPLIYKLLPDGSEALTNSHMESETGTVVVHETAANFILRYGQSVLAIRNDGFNPNGKRNVLGTTVPNAIRLKKEVP